MNIMIKIRAIIFSFFVITFTSLNAYDSNPEIFVSELVKDVIQKLSDKNINDKEKAEFIE